MERIAASLPDDRTTERSRRCQLELNDPAISRITANTRFDKAAITSAGFGKRRRSSGKDDPKGAGHQSDPIRRRSRSDSHMVESNVDSFVRRVDMVLQRAPARVFKQLPAAVSCDRGTTWTESSRGLYAPAGRRNRARDRSVRRHRELPTASDAGIHWITCVAASGRGSRASAWRFRLPCPPAQNGRCRASETPHRANRAGTDERRRLGR